MTIPDRWTDDMNIVLPAGLTVEHVVDTVLRAAMRRESYESIIEALVVDGISASDAALAWDRVHGGVVRAATGNPTNCPDRSKDPLAWTSFHRAMGDTTIIHALYPYSATTTSPAVAVPSARITKRWWRFWR